MRIVLGDTRDKFGFNHRDWYPGTAGTHFRENALNCQDAKSIFGDAKWTASAQARPIVAGPPGEAGRGNRTKALIAGGGPPQSKPSNQGQTVHGLRDPGLLGLAGGRTTTPRPQTVY